MSLRYEGSAIFDRSFDAHLVTLHNLGLNISTTVGLSQTTALYPFFSVVRVWANPDDFSNTALVGGGTLVHALTQTVVVFFQGQVDYKSYDDFFEPSTLEARHDYGARLLAALNWTPREWVTVNISATIARNESTISTLREFSAFPFGANTLSVLGDYSQYTTAFLQDQESTSPSPLLTKEGNGRVIMYQVFTQTFWKDGT